MTVVKYETPGDILWDKKNEKEQHHALGPVFSTNCCANTDELTEECYKYCKMAK